MADPYFKAHIGGNDYELARLTLGDTRILKAKFGLVDLDAFRETDPDILCGLLYLCLIHEGMDEDAALEQVEAIDLDDFSSAVPEDAEPVVEESPTVPASDAPAKSSGAPETRRKPRGTPRSPTT